MTPRFHHPARTALSRTSVTSQLRITADGAAHRGSLRRPAEPRSGRHSSCRRGPGLGPGPKPQSDGDTRTASLTSSAGPGPGDPLDPHLPPPLPGRAPPPHTEAAAPTAAARVPPAPALRRRGGRATDREHTSGFAIYFRRVAPASGAGPVPRRPEAEVPGRGGAAVAAPGWRGRLAGRGRDGGRRSRDRPRCPGGSRATRSR